ncbi:MAG: OmpA family protein [Bdellovibrionaceae bacterium]|nr:OmpA family protein [Pseudobdellovibrionaceae bacterium]
MQHKKSRVTEEEHSHPMVHDESNWLVSYADMMTLLFGFFVLMYSYSKIDEEKFEVVKKDLVKYFGGKLKEANGAWTLKKTVDEKLNAILLNGGQKEQLFNMEVQDNTLKIIFQSKVLFGSGSVELTASSAKVIDEVARELRKFPLESIEVEGHTDIDAVQNPYFPSNWELSAARSSRIVRRLIENQLPDNILIATGYGSSRPQVPHFDENKQVIPENKEKNRRVELHVKLKPEATYDSKDLAMMGFKVKQSPAEQAEVEKREKEASDLKTRYAESQKRLDEVNQKLREAQEREKSIKEMERMAKKAEEIEAKIKSIQEKTKDTVERTKDLKDEARDPAQAK